MAADKPLTLHFAGFELDEANARLMREGRPVPLQPRALALLCTLARQPGRLLSKEALLDAIWGHRHVAESALKTTVSALRQALGDDPRQSRIIETVARKGYRFIAAPAQPAVAAPPIGRAAELQRLQQAWRRTAEGVQLVWVSGEAGIGKTRLIDAFAASLSDVPCARGQCLEHFGCGEPYLPWLALLGELSRRDERFVTLLRGVAPMWLLQLPWLCAPEGLEALRNACAGANPQRMLREMAELLHRYCERQALLLVLEDLHWSDSASIGLLEYLLRGRQPARLLLLCSLRPGELAGSGHPLEALRHDLNLRGLSEELALRPLGIEQLGEYLARRWPQLPMPEERLALLHQRSGGLPLFVEGLAADLDALSAQPDWPLPDSLEGLLRRQIQGLDEEQCELLEAASLCGAAFRVGVLASVLGRAEPRVQAVCRALTSGMGWLVEREVCARADGSLEASFAFRHALYRQAFYLRPDRLRQAHLHRAVAAALIRRGEPLAAELAEHFERGMDIAAAVQQLQNAVAGALERFSAPQALQHVRHGLELLGRLVDGAGAVERRLDLLLKGGVASAQQHGMASVEASEFYAQAQALAERMPDSAALGWGLAGIAQVRYGRGEYQAASALGERVLALAERLGEPALEIAACNLLGMACAVRGEHERGSRLLERGIALAEAQVEGLPRQRFPVDPLVAMQAHLALHLLPLGRFAQADMSAEAALRRARALAQPLSLAVALRCAGMLDLLLGRYRPVHGRAEELAQLHAAHGLQQAEGASRILSGWASAQAGDAVAGHALIREGGAILQRLGMLAGHVQVLGFAADARLLAGEHEAAQALLAQAEELAVRLGERARLPELWLLRARAELLGADRGAAERWLRRALTEAREQGAPGSELAALLALSRLPEPAAADRMALGRLCRTLAPAPGVPLLGDALALTEG